MKHAYTIESFCEAYDISPSLLYKEWRNRRGPKFYRVGAKRFISQSAALAWQLQRETATIGAVTS